MSAAYWIEAISSRDAKRVAVRMRRTTSNGRDDVEKVLRLRQTPAAEASIRLRSQGGQKQVIVSGLSVATT